MLENYFILLVASVIVASINAYINGKANMAMLKWLTLVTVLMSLCSALAALFLMWSVV